MMKKKLVLIVGSLLIGLLLVTLVIAFIPKSKQPNVTQVQPKVNEQQAVDHLAKAIQFQTVSFDDRSEMDEAAFTQFLRFLEKTYPNTYDTLDVKKVNTYSLLMKWKGADSEKEPIGLMAHYDVVPVAKGTEANWEQDAFGGYIDDTYIWGRGSLDDKVSVIGILEAVEKMIQEGQTPKQDVYLFFGHDEEIGGEQGAAKIVEQLKADGVQLRYVLDEGGVIVDDMVPGVSEAVGVVGVAEKGSAEATLTVEDSGGHSSQPKDITTIGRLSKAIAKLEETQFTSSITGPTAELFDYMTPEMSFGYKYIFANDWLFKPVIQSILLKKPATAAVTRTTIAPTIFKAGDKNNILPERASATINLRIIPGDTLASIKEEMTNIIDDSNVKITIEGDEASSVSSTENDAFSSIQKAALAVQKNTVIAPYIMIGASDSKHYESVATDTYRFLPIKMEADGLERMHGTNERIEKEQFIKMIGFYEILLSE